MPALAQQASASRPAPRYSVAGTYGNPNAASFRFRARRFRHLQPVIEAILVKKGSCRIADIGGTEYYWDIFGDYVARNRIEIDLVNLAPAATRSSQFNSLVADATDLAHIDDNAYDLVHSNSVIEHVGSWANMSRMAANVRRLAPAYFVQTPNFWFPVEPHFRFPCFHWLPEQVRAELLMRMNLGFGGKRPCYDSAMRGVQSAVLLSRKQMRHLFPDAQLLDERVAGLTKSLMAVRAG